MLSDFSSLYKGQRFAYGDTLDVLLLTDSSAWRSFSTSEYTSPQGPNAASWQDPRTEPAKLHEAR